MRKLPAETTAEPLPLGKISPPENLVSGSPPPEKIYYLTGPFSKESLKGLFETQPNLQILVLDGQDTKITDKILAEVLDCVPLKRLHALALIYCDIGDSGLALLERKQPELKTLEIRSCRKITDEGIRFVGKLKQLQALRLKDCKQITSQAHSHLRGLTQLKRSEICLVHRNFGVCLPTTQKV